MNVQNLVGQTLDNKYRIQKEIGRGGMGAVYHAVHLGTKRPVAVKVIVPQFMQRTEFVERFKREAEAAGRLHHPNVVDVTDFGFSETREGRVAYLVMEYLEGCTLGEILAEEKHLSLLWTVDILEQVCLAVSEAHRQGIIHRDLKPDNIWLEPNARGGYNVKVLDFGIAKLESQTEEFNSGIIQLKASNSSTNDATINYPANLPAIEDIDKTNILLQNKELPILSGYETFIERPGEDSFSKTPHSSEPQVNARRDVPPSQLKTLVAPADEKLPSQQETLVDFKVAEPIPKPPETGKQNLYEKSTVELTRIGALMGTPLYMSPEQCRAERLATSSDIYSLGVIAYQMLSGKTPFEGEYLSVISGHLQFPPPPLKARGVPRKVKKVIGEALSKEPIKRPASAEIFSSQLRSHSENIISIFQRALVIYVENFSKLVWFSLLLYFPTILLAAATFFISILKFNGVFSTNLLAGISTVLLSLIKHFNLAVSVAGETLIAGAVAWVVVQYIDTPLRSFRVFRAFQALLEKWRLFAWILPLRILVNLLIQGDLPGFPIPVVFLLSFLDTLIFWAVPSVVIMENLRGLAILKRGWQLTLKSLSTVTAAIFLNLFIFFIVGVSVTLVTINLAAFVSQHLFPSVAELPWEQFTEIANGVAMTAIKTIGALLLPFFAVVTTLIYLKTRHAGGESMKVLLDKLKNAEVLQSNWQKRVMQSTGNFSQRL